MTIGNILGHVFMDVGAAWDNSREFTNYSLLQAKYGNNLSDDFSPWVRTVGYGIKLPIFLPWRIEAATEFAVRPGQIRIPHKLFKVGGISSTRSRSISPLVTFDAPMRRLFIHFK